MQQLVIEGVYRKNSRGRAYLIFRDANKNTRIIRVSSRFEAENGATVTLIGHMHEGRFLASRVIPREFPIRTSRAKRAS